MEPCRGCGADLSSDDRFCSQCGEATTADFELLGTEPAVSTQQAVRRGGRPKGPVVALLAFGAVAGFVWLVSALASTDDYRPKDDEAAEPTTTSSTAPSTSTTERSATNPADSGPTTSTTQVADGPLLGRETGLSLLVGGSHLRRIDLDTGLLTGFELRGVPLVESDGWLVLANPNSGDLFAVPVDDPDDGERVDLPGSRFGPTAIGVVESTPGFVRMPAPEGDTFSMITVELSSGDVVDREASTPWFIGRSTAVDVTVAPDGSIYERTDGVYRRVGDGGFLAANTDFMLVNDCVDPVTCSLGWIDRSSGQAIDRPLPTGSGQYYGGTLSRGGRVLVLWGFDEPTIFDVDRGELVDLGVVDFIENLAVSPDERYVCAIDVKPTIADLDTGETVKIDVTTGGFSQILFVEMP
ncbi:MAG: zinc ribbon domain-containing protein [Acidimicrobiales bacterium]